MKSALFECPDSSNIRYLSEMMASKIAHQNNDMREWKHYRITYILTSLVKEDSTDKDKEAAQKIVAYLTTKNCNLDNWGGHKLSILLTSLVRTDVESADMAILKVLDIIVKSGLSFWNTKSTSTLLKSLAKLKQKYSPNIVNQKSYNIALQLVMDYFVQLKVNFTGFTGSEIAFFLKSLRQIPILGQLDKIALIRQKMAQYIIDENIHISSIKNDDWILIIRGLDDRINIEKEAIKVIADCLNVKKVDMSKWPKNDVLNIITTLSYQDGLRIDNAVHKIGTFIAKTHLNYWDTKELLMLAELFISKSRAIHHNALDNISCHILHRSKNLLDDDYINIAVTLSRGKGDNCLALIRKIANEVRDDNFDISSRTPMFLSNLVRILSQDENDKYVGKAINKIADLFIYNNAEQLLSIPPNSLKIIIGGFSKHYKLTAVKSVIRNISRIVINESTNLSDWPIETMAVLLRTLSSSYDDSLIQIALRKIVAQLNRSDTELHKWSIMTLASVAKGVSNLRDYSSEKFIARLAKIYMKKRDDNENKYGSIILKAIYHLPIESSKIIKTAVKLASVLSHDAHSNTNTNKENKISLFWSIILLEFVVHDKWRKTDSHGKTKTEITKLTKTIHEIDQDPINQHSVFLAAWQREFINITYSQHAHPLDNITSLKHNNNSGSISEDHIYKLIKNKIPGLRVEKNCLLNLFPVDLLLSSRSKSKHVAVEVDGPQHFFKGSDNKVYRLAKDRFIDFIFENKLGYKVIRIDHWEAHDYECRKHFIQQILAVFPNYAH
ncbi:MAG: hypothetical protein QS748_06315 [Candidatus Endonucleobacter bathymodioli]|uniref:RAP domain-containing protein n=1 Tax=Candidatus Endonucleibacter bathymodioli TaxID=539814 RepID=A0AA90NT55_9GAMM|nr:hypothetical protein [Candidatus Endonucleobacter bathymodioli]